MVRTFAKALVAASFMLAATLAHAGESDAVKRTVTTWFAKLNAGNGVGALALNSEQGSIIDEIAPYRWTRFDDWFKSYDSYAAANGISASKDRLGKFLHVNVKDGRAYVVVTLTYTYRENGKPRAESGLNVMSLAKTDAGWRITSVAWLGKNGVDAGADAAAIGNAVSSFTAMTAPPSPPPVAIVDEFPPYHWEGASANADWMSGLMKDNADEHTTDMKLKLDAPSQLAVNSDWAYAVYPTVITSRHRGKPSAEHGAFAFTLQKQSGTWQIVSWAWATR